MEGYLLIWAESGDEVHINLISPEDAKKFEANISNPESVQYEPLVRWFTQTRCVEPWPFSNCTILGTICVCMA